MEDTPKSPKTPKLSEEISELVIEADSNNNEAEKSTIVEVEAEAETDVVVDNKEQQDNEEDENKQEVESVDVEDNCEKFIDPRGKEILSDLIMNSPAGQSQTVSNLCLQLFGNDFKDFIEGEEREKLIKDGFIERNEIVESGEVDNEESANESKSESKGEFEGELRAKMDNYIKELFPETGKHLINQVEKDSWEIQIIGHRTKPKAFWSGHWHSTWSINFVNDGEFSINGNVQITVHYHEEGTVQLSAQKEIKSRVNMKFESESQAADKIYWKIKDSEDTIQVALNESYQQLGDNIFKKLRRQLPVTRTKMDWAKFSNYNLSTELKQ